MFLVIGALISIQLLLNNERIELIKKIASLSGMLGLFSWFLAGKTRIFTISFLDITIAILKNILIVYTLELYPIMISHFAIMLLFSFTLAPTIISLILNMEISILVGSILLIFSSFAATLKLRETYLKPLKLYVDEYDDELLQNNLNQ